MPINCAPDLAVAGEAAPQPTHAHADGPNPLQKNNRRNRRSAAQSEKKEKRYVVAAAAAAGVTGLLKRESPSGRIEYFTLARDGDHLSLIPAEAPPGEEGSDASASGYRCDDDAYLAVAGDALGPPVADVVLGAIVEEDVVEVAEVHKKYPEVASYNELQSLQVTNPWELNSTALKWICGQNENPPGHVKIAQSDLTRLDDGAHLAVAGDDLAPPVADVAFGDHIYPTVASYDELQHIKVIQPWTLNATALKWIRDQNEDPMGHVGRLITGRSYTH